MKLNVVSPKGVICSTEVEYVKLPGSEGQFTVMRNHAPIMAMLVKGDIIYMEAAPLLTERSIRVEKGVVNVSHNVIDVCVE